jgi:hypothetical protein
LCFESDNLAFRAELLVKRKHSRYGEQRFSSAIFSAVASLNTFKQAEADRIKRLQYRDLKDDESDALILRSFERGIISAPVLPRVIREWRRPSHEEFAERTAWSLLNCFTTVLGERHVKNPQAFAIQTIRLQQLFDAQPENAHAA